MPDCFSEETPEESAMRAMRRREPEAFFVYEKAAVSIAATRLALMCNIPEYSVCPDLYPCL